MLSGAARETEADDLLVWEDALDDCAAGAKLDVLEDFAAGAKLDELDDCADDVELDGDEALSVENADVNPEFDDLAVLLVETEPPRVLSAEPPLA